jgi:hypothetical protein
MIAAAKKAWHPMVALGRILMSFPASDDRLGMGRETLDRKTAA